jgi:acyl carrier protein
LNVSRKECVPEADFIDDLGADSIDIVELVMAIEDNFNIEISDEELKKNTYYPGYPRFHSGR